MNAARRQQIEAIKDRLIGLQSDLEILRDEEQDYFENMPDAFQAGEKGDKAQTAIAALDDCVETIHGMTDQLDEAAQ